MSNKVTFLLQILITSRKRGLRRLCFYTCLSFSQCGGWYPSMPCSRSRGGGGWGGVGFGCYPSMPCRFPGPHPEGKLRGIWPGGSPGPHPRGELRGIWLGGLQAHTQGGSLGGSGQGGLQAHTQGGS